MKVSIVTISFNQSIFLRQCIESVLSQAYPSLEYIIVDPGSTDGSREIIDSYGPKIIKIFEPDSGPADGLNKGFSVATGDIFCFINSDDFLLPGSLQIVNSFFQRDPALDVLLGAGIEVNYEGAKTRSLYPSRVSKNLYVNGAVTFFQQGMFFKSDLYKKCKGFNVANKSCWDGELLLSFILCGARIKRTMKKFAAFRLYPSSITGSQRLKEIYKTDQNLMYQCVYGKDKKSNFLSRGLFRLYKIIADPKYTFYRLIKGG